MIGSKLTLQALMRNDLTGQADEHGLTRIKKKVCFALGEKRHIASRPLRMPGHGSAARRFVLICGYRARSRLAWQTVASEAGGSVQILPAQLNAEPVYPGCPQNF